MPEFAIEGSLDRPEDYNTFEGIKAATPLAALHRLHAEALGRKRVRLRAGRLVFADPADRALCSGVWRVTRVANNGTPAATMFEISENSSGLIARDHRGSCACS